jgi:hypothetical protein
LNRPFTILNAYAKAFPLFGVFDIENITYDRDGNISNHHGAYAKSSKEFKHAVALWDGKEKVFYKAEDLKNFLLSKEHIGRIWYGHNVEYDLSGIFENILTIPDSKILMNGGRFIELKISLNPIKKGYEKRHGRQIKQKYKRNYIKFWDTYNIIPMALKQIGKIFNLDKLKFDTSDINYCRRDCEITHKIVEKYREYCIKFNISPRLTTSSTAMTIFRTAFLKNDIWINDNDLFFKNSYIGGRCEVIKKFMVSGCHYDVNSLYPAAMCENFYPDPSKVKKGVLNNFDYCLNNFEGVVFCKVFCTDMHIPILPYKMKDKIIYPVGTFSGWYNFNEIRFALKRGYEILEVYEYYFSKRIETPFKEYVKYWFDQKTQYKNKDAGFYDFSKRMMNGLYGKFGEYHDNGTWGNIIDDPRSEDEIKANIDVFKLFSFIEVNSGFGNWIRKGETLKDQITDHTIFGWCSYVTSYARMILYESLEKSGLENIFYYDTDSKFTSIFQESSMELGKMKLEHENIKAYFAAPKMYQIVQNIECSDFVQYSIEKSLNRDENKLKGVTLNGKDIFQKRYIQNRVNKSRESLKRGMESGKWIKMIKEPSGIDNKRIWLSDGTSHPIRITE